MENENKEKQDCGCSGPDCCPPKKNKLWMKILFGVIILAAATIITIKLACPHCGGKEKCAGTEKSCCADSTKSGGCSEKKSGCPMEKGKSDKCDKSKGASCCPKDSAK